MTITNTIAQLKGTIDSWIENKINQHEEKKHQENELEKIRLDINNLKNKINNIEELTDEKINAGLLNGYSSSDFVSSHPHIERYTDLLDIGFIIAVKQGNIVIIYFFKTAQKINNMKNLNGGEIKNHNWNLTGINLPTDFIPNDTIYAKSEFNENRISVNDLGQVRVYVTEPENDYAYDEVYGTLTYIVNDLQKESKIINVTDQSIMNNFTIGDSYYIKLVDSETLTPLSNKEVIIKVNTVSYKRKLDNEGRGFLKINLDKGSYDIETTFNGDNQYKKSSLKTNIYVHEISDINIIVDSTSDINKVICKNNNGSTIEYINCVVNINGIDNTMFLESNEPLLIDLSQYKGDVNIRLTIPSDELRVKTTTVKTWTYKTGR